MNKLGRRLAACLLFGCGLVTGTLQGKTVALWKLDYEGDGNSLNTRCRIDPANDLAAIGTVSKATAVDAWSTLPSNPDTSTNTLANATNQNAIYLTLNAADPRTSLTNATFASKVNITNSFTIEGWVNRANNPSGSSWFYMVGSHSSGAGRWILSLRNGGTNWILFVDSQIGDKAFPVKNDPASTNIWRHLALTYDRAAGSAQQGVWELFVDSQSCGTLTNSSRTATLATSDDVFMLGGRPNGVNTGNARLDYWRVSDAVLTTNEFMNAGTVTPEPETTPRTLAYWRMDGDDDGGIDARDFVGNARLSGNMDITNYTTSIRPAAVQAFDGQPPNSAVALPAGNGGSAYAQAAGACLRVPDLGAQLEITNSFTVEGWLCPHRQDYDTDVQYIVNTRIDTKGWAFALKKNGAMRQLVIFAEDDGGTQVGDQPLSEDLSAWSDTWKHVALVYDATAGSQTQGVWNCYLDGVLQRSATNNHAVIGTSGSVFFHLAGRLNNGNTICGYLDCWRACKAALSPSQFLNADQRVDLGLVHLPLAPDPLEVPEHKPARTGLILRLGTVCRNVAHAFHAGKIDGFPSGFNRSL